MPKTLHDHYMNLVVEELNEAAACGYDVHIAATGILERLGLGADPLEETWLASQ